MTLNDRATRMTARIAPYKVAIAEARRAGLTWRDIAQLLGIQGTDAVRQAVRKCQWTAEQMPLPEPLPQQPARQPQQATTAAGTQATSGKKTFDSLPQIGQIGGK